MFREAIGFGRSLPFRQIAPAFLPGGYPLSVPQSFAFVNFSKVTMTPKSIKKKVYYKVLPHEKYKNKQKTYTFPYILKHSSVASLLSEAKVMKS